MKAEATYDNLRSMRNAARGVGVETVQYRILTLMLGEVETIASRVGKSPEPEDIQDTARRLIKANESSMQAYMKMGRDHDAALLQSENAVLSLFLPDVMDDQTIYDIINNAKPKSIGEVFKLFRAEFAGEYDSGALNRIAKEYFS